MRYVFSRWFIRLGRGWALAALSCAIAIACGSDTTAAGPIRLNGPLVIGGDVEPANLQFSPDSSRVLYLADQRIPGLLELFSVPSGGGTAVRLNAPLGHGEVVDSFLLQISPDSSRVLYLAGGDGEWSERRFELFSVPSTGGTAVKLNGPLVEGGSVSNSGGFHFSPDSSRVLYRADQTRAGMFEIFSVPSTGGNAIKLNGPMPAQSDVSSASFSPDGSRVLYHADQLTLNMSELFSVPSEGGDWIRLNGPLQASGDVATWRFSPDGNQVLFRADQTDGVTELFITPIVGGTVVKLNGPLVEGGDVWGSALSFSPDGSQVLYLADQRVDGTNELYIVPSVGGTPLKLNGPLVAIGNVQSGAFTPDGSRVIYHADQFTDNVRELFSVPSGGGTPVRLNIPLDTGSYVATWQISPDGSRLIYRAHPTNNQFELYSVPTGGGESIKLNGELVAGGDVSVMEYTPDGSRVVYLADQDTDDVNEVYIVPSGGGTVVKLNGPLVAGGSVATMQLSPDGSRVLYLADEAKDNVMEAFVRIVRDRFATSGGSWDAGANWDSGVSPDEVMQVYIDKPAVVTVTGGDVPRLVNELVLGGGGGASVLQLRSGAVVSTINGLSIRPGGVLRGDGVMDAGASDVTSPAGAELRVDAGERLRLSSATFTNAGSVQALGTSAASAEIEFGGPLTNAASTGFVIAENATLRFTQGISNSGSIALGFGTSRVFGDVSNTAGGRIAVSGGGQVAFYDDVSNSGNINVSAAGALPSTAVFFGALTGNGVSGGGRVFIEGDLRPGFSPGAMSFGGDVSFGPLATLQIEIGGVTPGAQFDNLTVAGEAALAGRLEVVTTNQFSPTEPGEHFVILAAESLTGTFDEVLGPPSNSLPGLFWSMTYTPTSVILSTSAMPGDINLDGNVDSRDAAAFARFFGSGAGTWATGDFNGDAATTLADLALLQSYMGSTITPNSAATAVPEPTAIASLWSIALLVVLRGVSTKVSRYRAGA